MRLEVPPICRLTASNRANQSQRLLADMEGRLARLASRVSMGVLAPALMDPMLKIDEVSRSTVAVESAGRPLRRQGVAGLASSSSPAQQQ